MADRPSDPFDDAPAAILRLSCLLRSLTFSSTLFFLLFFFGRISVLFTFFRFFFCIVSPSDILRFRGEEQRCLKRRFYLCSSLPYVCVATSPTRFDFASLKRGRKNNAPRSSSHCSSMALELIEIFTEISQWTWFRKNKATLWLGNGEKRNIISKWRNEISSRYRKVAQLQMLLAGKINQSKSVKHRHQAKERKQKTGGSCEKLTDRHKKDERKRTKKKKKINNNNKNEGRPRENKVKKSEIIWSRGGVGHYQSRRGSSYWTNPRSLLMSSVFSGKRRGGWRKKEDAEEQRDGGIRTSASRASSGEARPREMEKLKPPEIG
ncbi:hypothetical protein CDAR_18521 [Caerostris darwini]|uniref:Uncharacterized protein n=1 Tax=Caerostris darwini TaxID=1538125 RepID=A0AAV4V9M6_9ARAC|nr:hypothetical protein CDAR_18521 [Caerostris darwini]